MKLELKHLAPYLPYGLKGQFKLSEASILARGQKDELREKILTIDNVSFFLKLCKPLLFPLSEFKMSTGYETLSLSISDIDTLPYSSVTKLISQHFDVFGLIDAGLAVNINTNISKN